MPYKNIKKLKKIFLKKIASRKTVENRFLKFKKFFSNGQEYKLQNKVLIKNDRILLSLTNISKLFKMTNGNINDGISQDIEWDGSLRTVSVKIK